VALRHVTVAFALTGVVTTASLAARSAKTTAPPTVSCSGIVLQVRSGHAAGYRVVLGTVSVPPAYLPQVVPSRNKAWPFWRKAGLNVRGGSSAVVVTVPKLGAGGWRSHGATARLGADSRLRRAPPSFRRRCGTATPAGSTCGLARPACR